MGLTGVVVTFGAGQGSGSIGDRDHGAGLSRGGSVTQQQRSLPSPWPDRHSGAKRSGESENRTRALASGNGRLPDPDEQRRPALMRLPQVK